MFTLQSALLRGESTILLLYLWLSCAYGLANRRTHQRYWWVSSLMWLNWIWLFFITRPHDTYEFQSFPLILFTITLGMPLVVIFVHLLGYGRFPHYQHPRDVLLFRHPSTIASEAYRARQETFGMSTLAIVIVLISVTSWSLRPCHWLDRAVGRSGCKAVFLYDGLLHDLTFSPDGNLLAIAADDGVHIWQTQTMHLMLFLPAQDGAKSVAFSPDGRLIASGGYDNFVSLHTVTGALLYHLPTTDTINSVTFSPDGHILSAGVGKAVMAWQAETGTRLWIYPTKDEVYSVRFAPKSLQMAVGTYGGVFLLQYPPREQAEPMMTTAPSYQLAFAPDGTMLASGTYGDSLEVWHLSDTQQPWVFRGSAEHEFMWSVVFSSNGDYLVGGSGNRTVRMWRTTDFTVFKTLLLNDQVRSVAIHPNNMTMAIGVWDKTVRLWHIPLQ